MKEIQVRMFIDGGKTIDQCDTESIEEKEQIKQRLKGMIDYCFDKNKEFSICLIYPHN